jgi:protein gp37
MAEKSSIEWTDATWNPVRGCTKVSPGCKFCYAETFAMRFEGVPNHPYEAGFALRLVPEKLEEPLKWRKPRRVFVNSMSDLFHQRVPSDYIRQVFDVMLRSEQHTFQLLTKRVDRALRLSQTLPWPENVWMGVSVENVDYLERAVALADVPAAVRFISAEPLLGPLASLPLRGIHWVIVGGESGRQARPMQIDWAREIRDQCRARGVAFFLKQLGGRASKRGGDDALLDGRRHIEYPVRQSSILPA